MYRGAFLATAAILSASTITLVSCQSAVGGIYYTPRQEWHSARQRWTMRALSKAQIQKVTRIISLPQMQKYILPHMLQVRPSGSAGNSYVRKIITDIMENILKWTVEYDTFLAKPPYPYQPTRFTNIIATHNPKAKRRLVLACHYDSKLTPRNFVGATDSAVPCAIMLEIAVALRSYLPTSGDLTLQLIFFDGEESFVRWSSADSLYGSRHLAETWEKSPWPPALPTPGKSRLDSIDLLAVLDLLGAANPKFYNSAVVRSTKFDELVRIERSLYGSNQYFQTAVKQTYVQDDHIPFYVRDVPILHVIPDPFPRQWHTLNDNANYLDPVSIKRLADIFAVFTAEYLHLNIT